jgi:hypothetical protein
MAKYGRDDFEIFKNALVFIDIRLWGGFFVKKIFRF